MLAIGAQDRLQQLLLLIAMHQHRNQGSLVESVRGPVLLHHGAVEVAHLFQLLVHRTVTVCRSHVEILQIGE